MSNEHEESPQDVAPWQHIYCLQRVISFSSVSVKKLVELGSVNSHFRESLEYYGAPIIQMLFENAQLPVWKNLPQLFSLLCRQKNHNLFWLADEILKASTSLSSSQNHDFYERLIFEAGPFGSYNSIETCVVQDNHQVLALLLEGQESILEQLRKSEIERSKIHYDSNNTASTASTQPPLLFLAVEKGSVECLRFLLETANVPVHGFYETKSSSPRSLLHHALYHNASIEIFRVLFQVGKIASLPGSEAFLNTPWSFHDAQGRQQFGCGLDICAHTVLSLAIHKNRGDVLELFGEYVGSLNENELLLTTFEIAPAFAPPVAVAVAPVVVAVVPPVAAVAPPPPPLLPVNPLVPANFYVPPYLHPQNSNLPPPPPQQQQQAPAAQQQGGFGVAAAPPPAPAGAGPTFSGESLGFPTCKSIAFIAIVAGDVELLKKFLQIFPTALHDNLSLSSTNANVVAARRQLLSVLVAKLFPEYANSVSAGLGYGGQLNMSEETEKRVVEEYTKKIKEQIERVHTFKKVLEILVDNNFDLEVLITFIFSSDFRNKKPCWTEESQDEFYDYVIGMNERNKQEKSNEEELSPEEQERTTEDRKNRIAEFLLRAAPSVGVLRLAVEKYKLVNPHESSLLVPLTKSVTNAHSRFNNPVNVISALTAMLANINLRDSVNLKLASPLWSAIENEREDVFNYLIDTVGICPEKESPEEWKFMLHLFCVVSSTHRPLRLLLGQNSAHFFSVPPHPARAVEYSQEKIAASRVEAQRTIDNFRRLFFNNNTQIISEIVNRRLNRTDIIYAGETDYDTVSREIIAADGANFDPEKKILSSVANEAWKTKFGEKGYCQIFPEFWKVSPLMIAIATGNLTLVTELLNVKETDPLLSIEDPTDNMTPEEKVVALAAREASRAAQDRNHFGGFGGFFSHRAAHHNANPDSTLCVREGIKTPILLFFAQLRHFFIAEFSLFRADFSLQWPELANTPGFASALGKMTDYPITFAIMEKLLKAASSSSSSSLPSSTISPQKNIVHFLCQSLNANEFSTRDFDRSRATFYPFIDKMLDIIKKYYPDAVLTVEEKPEQANDTNNSEDSAVPIEQRIRFAVPPVVDDAATVLAKFKQSYKQLLDEFVKLEAEEATASAAKLQRDAAVAAAVTAAANAKEAAKTLPTANPWVAKTAAGGAASTTSTTTTGATKNSWSTGGVNKPAGGGASNPWAAKK